MFTLNEMKIAPSANATVTEKLRRIELKGGRIIFVPTDWHPRLTLGRQGERSWWTPSRRGIHWVSLLSENNKTLLLIERGLIEGSLAV